MSRKARVSRGDVELLAMKLSEEFHHNFNVNFIIRDSFSEIYGMDGTGKGAYHPVDPEASGKGLISVIAENNKSIEDVESTLKHELMGHYLLNTYSLENKKDILMSVIRSRGEPSLSSLWDSVIARYPDKSPLWQAEEVFATVAEKLEVIGSFLERDIDISKMNRVTANHIGREIAFSIEEIKRGDRPQLLFPEKDMQFTARKSNEAPVNFDDLDVDHAMGEVKVGMRAPSQNRR